MRIWLSLSNHGDIFSDCNNIASISHHHLLLPDHSPSEAALQANVCLACAPEESHFERPQLKWAHAAIVRGRRTNDSTNEEKNIWVYEVNWVYNLRPSLLYLPYGNSVFLRPLAKGFVRSSHPRLFQLCYKPFYLCFQYWKTKEGMEKYLANY